jgi:hypothetical protein
MTGQTFGNARTRIARNWQHLALSLIAGAFSFQHIHDLALREGQLGLRAWGYPVLIDVVCVYCLQLIMTQGLRTAAHAMAWTGFLLFSMISLAANVLDALGRGWLAMAVSALPALSFLFVTFVSHLSRHRADPGTEAKPQAEQSAPPLPRVHKRPPHVTHPGTAKPTEIVRSLARQFPADGQTRDFIAQAEARLSQLRLPALSKGRVRSLLAETRNPRPRAR